MFVLVDKDGKPISIGELHYLESPYGNLMVAHHDRDIVQAVLDEHKEMVGGVEGWSVISNESVVFLPPHYVGQTPESEPRMVTWQLLMDKAYDTWQGSGWSYGEFLSTLDAKSRQAVLLGNMNYQIHNGGVTQWVDNGYGCYANEVLDILRLMGTKRAMEWYEKLKKFSYEHINTSERKMGFASGKYWKHELNYRSYDDDNDEKGCEAYNQASLLDDFYYAEPFNDEFVMEVEKFLST